MDENCYEINIYSFLENLNSPLGIVANPTNIQELYIVEQYGLIWKYNKDSKEKTIFLDIKEWIPNLDPENDERGLLSMAFNPEFGNERSIHKETFYIFYSTKNAKYKVAESYSKDTVKKGFSKNQVYYNCLSAFTKLLPNGSADKKSEIVLLTIQKKIKYHNGGKIAFGPDGFLYIIVGDGGPQEDPYNKAQDLSVWHGKILRINVSKESVNRRYDIPIDNPFINENNAKSEIYAYGLRNPWSICWDHKKRLIVADVGYDSKEEVNIIIKGGNYGWNYKEGTLISKWTDRIPKDLIDPVYQYDTPNPIGCIIGGYAISSLYDSNTVWYIFADISGLLSIIEENPETKIWSVIASTQFEKGIFIKSFGKIDNGDIFIMTSRKYGPSEKTGEILTLNFANCK